MLNNKNKLLSQFNDNSGGGYWYILEIMIFQNVLHERGRQILLAYLNFYRKQRE